MKIKLFIISILGLLLTVKEASADVIPISYSWDDFVAHITLILLPLLAIIGLIIFIIFFIVKKIKKIIKLKNDLKNEILK